MPSEALQQEKARVAYMEEQEKLADENLARFDFRVRKFFKPQYAAISNVPVGTFVGLNCKSCNHWVSHGHEKDCPVEYIFKLLYLKLVSTKPSDNKSYSTEDCA